MKKNFDTFVQVLNFLDVSIILHQHDRLETVMLCFIKKFTRMSESFKSPFETHKTEHTIQFGQTHYPICIRRGKDK